MELNQIRLSNFLHHIKEKYSNSINKFAKNNQVNVNQYYAIVRGEREFGDKAARKVEKLLGLNFWELDKLPDENINISRYYPLIQEGEPITKDPLATKLKIKVSLNDLPPELLRRLNLNENNIFLAEFKTSLFHPMINPYGLWVLEKFNGSFISGEYYLFYLNSRLYVYKVEENIVSRSLYDENNKKIFECPTTEQNEIIQSTLGRFSYGLIMGLLN